VAGAAQQPADGTEPGGSGPQNRPEGAGAARMSRCRPGDGQARST
jgi:hypothetical protein